MDLRELIEAGSPADKASVARALARMASSRALDCCAETLRDIAHDVREAEEGPETVSQASGPEFREHFAAEAWSAAVRAMRAVDVRI
jgi:hypothetical protein